MNQIQKLEQSSNRNPEKTEGQNLLERKKQSDRPLQQISRNIANN